MGADIIAAPLAAGAIDVGDDFVFSKGVGGESGGRAGFIVGVREDGHDVGLEKSLALFRRRSDGGSCESQDCWQPGQKQQQK